MTEAHGHAPQANPFSEAEWKELRRQDGLAGKMVGGLMATIFSIGVLIYSIVLWSTLS
jgi:hypothetical protein